MTPEQKAAAEVIYPRIQGQIWHQWTTGPQMAWSFARNAWYRLPESKEK